MALVKCPICELNYMQDSEKCCTVCKREMHGDSRDDTPEICTECGENPVVPGEELCYACLREIARHNALADPEDQVRLPAEDMLDPTSVSGMDEIEIEIDDDIPDREYKEIDRELGTEEEDAADDLMPDSIEALAESENEAEDEEE